MELKRFPERQLSPSQRTSKAVIRWTCEQEVENEGFVRHNFIFEHFRGVHVTLVHFLTTLQLRILELREKAKKKLGARFDIKQFHNTILRAGCVPFEVLEQEVDNWIETK